MCIVTLRVKGKLVNLIFLHKRITPPASVLTCIAYTGWILYKFIVCLMKGVHVVAEIITRLLLFS